MLLGSDFGSKGEPYIQGSLIDESLHIDVDVDMLADTGADRTLINPHNLIAQGAKKEHLLSLTYEKEMGGLGGSVRVHLRNALLVFYDDEFAYGYDVTIAIPHLEDVDQDMPSLLGRDVMQSWRMTFAQSRGELAFEALQSDYKVRIRGSNI